MAKYLRKCYILTNIKNSILIIKKNPSNFIDFLTLLNSPIIHKFYNPFTEKIIDEEKNRSIFSIKVLYFIFYKNQSFTLNKIKKKGRIKRKILRKLIIQNKLVD